MAPRPCYSTGWSPGQGPIGRGLAGGWAGCSSALHASVSPAVPQFPLAFRPYGCRQDHRRQSLPSPTAHPARWQHGDSAASKPALPAAPAQLPGTHPSPWHRGDGAWWPHGECPSLLPLLAPGTSQLRNAFVPQELGQSPGKPTVGHLQPLPPPQPSTGLPKPQHPPSGSSAQPRCSHKPAGCQAVGMLSHPQVFGGDPPPIPSRLFPSIRDLRIHQLGADRLRLGAASRGSPDRLPGD